MKSLKYLVLFENYSTIHNLIGNFFISLLIIFIIRIFKKNYIMFLKIEKKYLYILEREMTLFYVIEKK